MAWRQGERELWVGVSTWNQSRSLHLTVFRGPVSVTRLASGRSSGELRSAPVGALEGIGPDGAIERAWEEFSGGAGARGLLVTFGMFHGAPAWRVVFDGVCEDLRLGGGIRIGPSPLPGTPPPPSAIAGLPPTCPPDQGFGVVLDAKTGALIVEG